MLAPAGVRVLAQAEAIARELREAYARLPPLPPEGAGPGEAAEEAAAAAEAEAEAAEEAGKRQAAAAEQAGERHAAAAGAEAPGEPGPPSEADRPRAPSGAHTEL